MAQKQQNYFSHDFGARVKLAAMKYDYGLEGIGFYWCFVEILHEQGGVVKENLIKGIAEELRIDPEKATAIIKNYGLFTVRKGKVTCERVNANLAKKAQVSEARRQAAEQRWHSGSTDDNDGKTVTDTTPQQTQQTVGQQPREQLSDYDKERLNFYVDQIKERLQEYQAEGDGFDFGERQNASIIVSNIIKSVIKKVYVQIDNEKVSSADYADKLMYFTTIRGYNDLLTIIAEVEGKVANGIVKNKEKYLISALYKMAALNGESQNG